MIIRISRGAGDKYDEYNVKVSQEMTVLDILFHIQGNIDETLAFRYSCRGAVCGSCAILINGMPLLACKTPVSRIDELNNVYEVFLPKEGKVPEDGMLLEPIPKLPVLKDLVVDWEPFFEHFRKLELELKEYSNPPEKEYLLGKDQVRELEKYSNCISCALCWSACPMVGDVEGYPGPAALAKLYRFYLDPREPGNVGRLYFANRDFGWWACDFYTNCRKVCPKGVPPNIAIGKAQNQLKNEEDKK